MTRRPSIHLAFALLLWCALAAIVLGSLFGCTGAHPTPNVAVGTGLGAARGNVTSAAVAVESSKPHSDPTGKELLNGATQNLVAAIQAIDEAWLAETQTQDSWATDRTRADKAEQALKSEQDHYMGYKLRASLRIIIWSTLAIIAGGLVVFEIAANFFSTGPLGAIASRVLSLFKGKPA